jgi:Domain of unknown function (DUF4337)
MADEIQELRERAEKGAEDRNLAVVTVTMAILAVLIAGASLLGHRAHTEELLLQTQATDQWAYYQAKDIRRRSYEVLVDELSVFQLQNAAQGASIKDKYDKEIDRAAEQQKDIQAEATKAENEVKINGRRADRFDLGEVLLEASLVICSITLLTRKRIFLHLGILIGICGVAVAAAGFLIH